MKNRTGQFYERVVSVLVALAAMLVSIDATATDGHQLIGIGALQKGTGGAGVASAKDSTWVVLNPAALVVLGERVDVGLEVFAPDRFITPRDPGSGLPNAAAGRMSDHSEFYIPTAAMSLPLADGVLGFGLYGVNGMGVEYSDPRATPAVPGAFDRRTEYAVAKLSVAYARELDSGWALGAGLNLNYARFRTDMMTLAFAQTEGDNEWDESFGLGFSLGVRRKWERWGFGAVYISPQWMQTMDEYRDLLAEPLDLPQMIQLGVSYDVTPAVEVVVDYKFLDWSGVDQIGREAVDGGFGWDDQHVIKAGITWQASDKWTFRGGLSHGKAPIDDEHVFANSLFPAVMETHASVGFSCAVTEQSSVHVTYTHAFEESLTESGSGDAFSQAGAGTEIGMKQNTLTLGYSRSF